MKKILVTFGTREYRISKEKLVNSARHGDFDQIYSFCERDIVDLRSRFPRHFKKSVGYGFWLWKPYLIAKVLDAAAEGDVVFYCDAGCLFEQSAEPLFQLTDSRDIVSFEIDALQKDWTKREVFDEMLGSEGHQIREQKMRVAAYILFKKSTQSQVFLSSWLSWCERLELLNNELRIKQDANFKWHRNDQSIFSILCSQMALEGFRDPSQYGNRYLKSYSNSAYPQIINHTREGKLTIQQKIRKSIYPKLERIFRKSK